MTGLFNLKCDTPEIKQLEQTSDSKTKEALKLVKEAKKSAAQLTEKSKIVVKKPTDKEALTNFNEAAKKHDKIFEKAKKAVKEAESAEIDLKAAQQSETTQQRPKDEIQWYD